MAPNNALNRSPNSGLWPAVWAPVSAVVGPHSKRRGAVRSHRQALHLILLGLLLVTSLTAAGNEGRAPVIGQVWLTNPNIAAPFDQAFRNGLRELGYVEGANVTVVPRYAEGDATRIPALLKQLAALPVDVLLVSPAAVEAAEANARYRSNNPPKFLLIVNLKTAQALGTKLPSSVLLRADEVVR